jgi:hypothetical protein
MSVLELWADNTPEYKFINEETIGLMEKMIRSIFFNEEFEGDDSEHLSIERMKNWQKIGLTMRFSPT